MGPKKPPAKKPIDDENNPGIVTKISRLLGLTPPPKVRVPGFGYRIKNLVKCHWRGLIGFAGLFTIIGFMFDRDNNSKKVEGLWYCLAWLFFIRPISVPVTGMIPIFYLPMLGVMNSKATCSCYMNMDIMLFFVAGMVMLLLNNCGNDRRIALSIMTYGDTDEFSAKKMVFKCSTAAFILGMLSNRLISSSMITEYFTEAITPVEKKYGESEDEPEMDEVRYVVNNAIQTSSSIGSIALIPSSAATVCFRAIYNESGPTTKDEYPDVFNYLQYAVFAFPVALSIFLVNLFYHLYLVERQGDGNMSSYSKALLEKALRNSKSKIPKDVTLHEKLCISALVLNLIIHATRWNTWIGGWAIFVMDSKSIPSNPLPAIKDTTVAAFFAVILHMLPCGFSFLRYFIVSKRKDLPKLKAESGILWWKYVDKNINYGYFFLMGSGVALMVGSIKTGLDNIISENLGDVITNKTWNTGIFLVILISCVAANLFSSTAACVIILPYIISATKHESVPLPWPTRSYLAALGVGIACSFGYGYPYLYSPAYFCHYVGKVPRLKMIQYSFISLVISITILWAYLAYFAPMLWDPSDQGFPVLTPTTTPPPERL